MRKYEFITENGEKIVKKTTVFEKYQKEVILKSKLKRSNLNIDLYNYDINRDYIGPDKNQNKYKIETYIKKFDIKFNRIHLYFWSEENSTQKTTLASYIAKELLKINKTCHLITMNDLCKKLQEYQFSSDLQISHLIDKLETCDYLIIDDCFDSKKMTVYKSGYQIPFLDTFFRQRLEVLKKATCFTSNVNINNIDTSIFGVSLYKLISRNVNETKQNLFEFLDSVELKNNFKPENLWD